MKASIRLTIAVIMLLIFAKNTMANDDFDPIPGERGPDYSELYRNDFGSNSLPQFDCEFPPEGWSTLQSNSSHTWKAASIAFNGMIYEDELDFNECFALIKPKGTGQYDELLITEKIDHEKIEKAGCKDFFVYAPYVLKDCELSVEINQEDDLENRGYWRVIDVLATVKWPDNDHRPLWWYYNVEFARWRDDEKFFDVSKGFRVGLRYIGENCLGVVVSEVFVGCYKRYFDPDDYDDDDWGDDDDYAESESEENDDKKQCSCGASGSGPNMLPVLFMAFIGIFFWRIRKAV